MKPELQVETKLKTSPAIGLGIGIGVLAVLSIGASLTFALFPVRSIADPDTATCVDTNPGAYPNSYGKVAVRGQVSGQLVGGVTYAQSDWCAGDNFQLQEQFCYTPSNGSGKVPGQTGYNCQNGCSNGACIGAEVPTCNDSQPTADIYTRGFVQGVDPQNEFYRFEDACSGTGLQVNKYWCYPNPDGQGSVNGRQVMNCPSGQCVNGACVR